MRGFLAIAVAVLLSLALGPAQAQEVSKTCDITVQNQMKQQGWLEGQRELEMAQRLILKPDSVLEYSCFERIAKNFQNADSGSRWPGGDPGGRAWNFANYGGGSPPGNIGNAINGMVLNAFYPYLNNFGHLFLGGTFADEGGSFLTGLADPNALCNPHYWIWYLAKCVNVSWEENTTDGHLNHYFPLDKLANRNLRNKPQSCPAANITARDQLVTDVQKMQTDFPDPEKPDPKKATAPYGVDNANRITGTPTGTKYSAILNGPNCGPLVKTGIKVQALSGGGSGIQDDIVCITPGCYPSGGSCSK